MSYKNVSLLDLVEAYGAENNLISSEEELSEQFDEWVAPMVIEEYGEDDTIAMSEAFSNWADARCRDGDIHDEQYACYDYVGKYA